MVCLWCERPSSAKWSSCHPADLLRRAAEAAQTSFRCRAVAHISRKGAKAAFGQLRQFTSSPSGLQAAPALAEGSASSSSWLGSLFGGSSRISIPLSEPLPGSRCAAPCATPHECSHHPDHRAVQWPQSGLRGVLRKTWVACLASDTISGLPHRLHWFLLAVSAIRPDDLRFLSVVSRLQACSKFGLAAGWKAECIAVDSAQGPTATIGLYVDAGSVYESAQQTGEPALCW